MVSIENELAPDDLDQKLVAEIPRETLDEIIEWLDEIEFDEDDEFDIFRTEDFGEFTVDVEHRTKVEDSVTVRTDDTIVSLFISNFKQL